MNRRRVVLALVLVLVLALVVAGLGLVLLPRRGSDKNDEGSKPPGAVLTGNQALLLGVVTDDTGKKPLAGAVITIDHAGGPTTMRTGPGGRYQVVVDASRPIGLTVDAPGHKGAVAFGKLCPGERRTAGFALPSAGSRSAPPAPVVLEEQCPGKPASGSE